MKRPKLTAAISEGWQRVDGGASKVNATWDGPLGFRLQHCGHPTANTPWMLIEPCGDLVLMGVDGDARNPAFGTCWPDLVSAMTWVRGHGEDFLASGKHSGRRAAA